MSGKSDKLFLGKAYDLEQGEMLEEFIHYDPDDLTTHAVITGMTGSGKTGLGVIMLEEAALQGIPAIVVDPKGDLTNLLLHFPDLLPDDFQPWVDQDAARREGISVDCRMLWNLRSIRRARMRGFQSAFLHLCLHHLFPGKATKRFCEKRFQAL